MTKAELIRALKDFPDDAEISVYMPEVNRDIEEWENVSTVELESCPISGPFISLKLES